MSNVAAVQLMSLTFESSMVPGVMPVMPVLSSLVARNSAWVLGRAQRSDPFDAEVKSRKQQVGCDNNLLYSISMIRAVDRI